jgi:hypothetical protein
MYFIHKTLSNQQNKVKYQKKWGNVVESGEKQLPL